MAAFVVVRHAPHEDAGLLGEVLEGRGRPLRLVDGRQADALAASEVRALTVLGGPETAGAPDGGLALVGRCLEAGVPMLALSSGARLLAEAAGGGIGAGRGGIGFVAVTRTADGRDDTIFHDFPDGAVCFASDAACLRLPDAATVLAGHDGGPPQAFRIGANAYGVQWHPELGGRQLLAWAEAAPVAGLLQGADLQALADEARRRDPFLRAAGAALLGRWVDMVVGRTDEEAPWGRRGPPPVPGPGLSLHPA